MKIAQQHIGQNDNGELILRKWNKRANAIANKNYLKNKRRRQYCVYNMKATMTPIIIAAQAKLMNPTVITMSSYQQFLMLWR